MRWICGRNENPNGANSMPAGMVRVADETYGIA